MYLNKATINTTAAANSGSNFSTNSYWSSTEYSNYIAWKQNFGNGFQFDFNKIDSNRVRAVRAF
jgi:hypothetical protein